MNERADRVLPITGSLLCLATGLVDSLMSAALAILLLGAAGLWKLRHDRQRHGFGSMR